MKCDGERFCSGAALVQVMVMFGQQAVERQAGAVVVFFCDQ